MRHIIKNFTLITNMASLSYMDQKEVCEPAKWHRAAQRAIKAPQRLSVSKRYIIDAQGYKDVKRGEWTEGLKGRQDKKVKALRTVENLSEFSYPYDVTS